MASKVNLTMDQGSYFEENFSIASADGVVNLSGYTAACQMRKHFTSLTAIDLVTVLEDSGRLVISLPSSNTASIEPGRYLYDVEITSPENSVIRVIEGIMTVTPNITR